jgi:hypothetical protein
MPLGGFAVALYNVGASGLLVLCAVEEELAG